MEKPKIQFGHWKENVEKGRTNPVDLLLDQLGAVPELGEVAASEMDLSFLTPEEKAESLWATFQSLKGAVSGRKKSGKQLDRLKLQLSIVKELKDDSETWAVFQGAYGRHITEIASINGDYEKYQALDNQVKSARGAYDATARDMFGRRGEEVDEVEKLLFEVNKRHLGESRAQMEELVAKNPDLGGLIQYQKLKEYAKQLREENFIWSPSRFKLREEIQLAALSKKPVLISGESGTGKTRLAEQVALALTGRLPNETPGKDVRFQDLIAKPKINPNGESFFEYKEIGEAFTGKENTLQGEPMHSGRLVLDDEFNLQERAEQTERLARIAAWTPGKKLRMPVTNEEVTIQPNSLYCAMVNLASERYERKKIPPEVLRKFAKVDVDYPEQTSENPELYEMMLASLMDENGRMRAAVGELAPEYEYEEQAATATKDGLPTKQTLQVRKLIAQKEVKDGTATRIVPAGGFLWRLANTLNQLNKAFSHRETVLKAKGDAQYLKDLPVDLGDITSWLREYTTLGRSQRLEDFIVERLNTQFLSKEAYSADDRALVKEFFRYYGIDTRPKSEDEEVPEFKNLTPLEVGLLSPRVEYKKVVSEEPTLDVMTIIDRGKRVEVYMRPFKQGKEEFTPGKIAKFPDGKMRIYRGLTKGGDPVWEIYQGVTVQKDRRREAPRMGIERAREILGDKNVLGPEQIEKAFGFRPDRVPDIPFSEEDLERAKELGQFLEFRVSHTPSGEPMSMKKMAEMTAPSFVGPKGKLLYNVDWYAAEKFYTDEAPREGWALVSREVIPNSTSKNYLEQTQVLADYLNSQFINGRQMPIEFEEAIREFDSQKAVIAPIITSDWKKAAEMLEALKINQACRQVPAEAIFDFIMRFQNYDERMLEIKYAWTSRRTSDGYLVFVGNADAGGASVGRWEPEHTHADIGVVFSRSL